MMWTILLGWLAALLLVSLLPANDTGGPAKCEQPGYAGPKGCASGILDMMREPDQEDTPVPGQKAPKVQPPSFEEWWDNYRFSNWVNA